MAFSFYLSRRRIRNIPRMIVVNPAVPMKIAEPNEAGNAVGLFVFGWEGRLTPIVRLLFARAVSPDTGLAAILSR